jgi:uncharacterized RDD family membrane protein YckC
VYSDDVSDPSVGHGAFHGGQQPGDRAVALLRELETHRTDEPQVASMASRLAARVFDLFLVGFTWFVLTGVAFVVRALADPEWWRRMRSDNPPDVPGWLSLVTAIALVVMLVGYELLCTLRWGQTAGKKMLGMRITRLDGRPASALALLWRTSLWAGAFGALLAVTFAPLVERVLVIAVLGAIFLAAHDRMNRSVFDLISGTRVVCPRK